MDSVRLTPAKAQLESRTQSRPVTDGPLERLSRTVESALVSIHGSHKAAAIEIDVDRAQLSRQLKLGTFDLRQQAAAGEAFLAAFGAALVEEFGAARKSKRQIALEQLPLLFQRTIEALTEAEE